MHYCRWRTHGDVLYPVEAQVHGGSALDRYWAKVDRSAGPEACWPWKGGCQRYGIFWDGTHRANGSPVMVKAHRWTYEQFVGPIPDGYSVCHRCDNPPCVNPAHLFLGSQTDNMRDMVSKGRNVKPVCPPSAKARGGRNGSAKIGALQVRAIRARYAAGGVSQQALADEYGITQTAVSSIVKRKTWQHIE